jgi:molybdenum cofactor biosynthesis enzyme MoaA
MAKIEHVHKLRRHRYSNGTKVYFCTLDCNYKIEAALALGKKSICNTCHDEFIMNEYSCKLAKPHCTRCGKMKVTVDGEVKFINKLRPNAALAEIAKGSTNSLRERLGKVVMMEKDEDI